MTVSVAKGEMYVWFVHMMKSCLTECGLYSFMLVNSLTSIAITEPKWELCTLIVRILPTLVGTKRRHTTLSLCGFSYHSEWFVDVHVSHALRPAKATSMS